MLNLNIHDFGRRGEANPDLIAAAIHAMPIPQRGAGVRLIKGPQGKRLALVLLAPGDGLGKPCRELLVSARALVCCTVCAEGLPGLTPRPDEFDEVTLRRMLTRSDYVAVWSASFPQFAYEYDAAGVEAIAGGAEFTVTILTTPDGAAEWGAFVRHWKRKKANLVFFGPENAEPVAGAASAPPVVLADISVGGSRA